MSEIVRTDVPQDKSLSELWKTGELKRSSFTAKELVSMEFDTEDMWLVEQLFPKYAVSILAGASDTGKSSLLRQLAISVALGDTEFLGRKMHAIGKNVIYVSTEDGVAGVSSGLKKQLTGLGKLTEAPENLTVETDTEGLHTKLKGLLAQKKCDLLIVDAWGDTFKGNPNDWQSVRADMKIYSDYCSKYQCTVIMLHHQVKNSEKLSPSKNTLNGSQAIEAKVRSVVELRVSNAHSEKQRLLTVTKCNTLSVSEKNVGHVLELDGSTMLFTAIDETVIFSSEGGEERKSKYDIDTWKPRIHSYLDTTTEASARTQRAIQRYLEEKFPGEAPTLHWINSRYKDDLLGVWKRPTYTISSTAELANVEVPKSETSLADESPK